MKTTKSYTKRLKVTKNGKIIGRRPGQNHFNAKESSSAQQKKNRSQVINMSNKDKARFLVGFK
jgi:ribosomal protein L35